MTIRLDHTIVPAKDKVASAEFFAEIFGLTVKLGDGHFAQVQINEHLTFDFADEPETWGGPGFDPRTGRSQHYAFHVSEAEFDAILSRVKARGIPYGGGPFRHTDGQINTRRGGHGFYFEDPNGHLLEVMTVPETGSVSP
jgi:catechol 2,3-dioxygenase-like lactoylglutathione lyase family enzyme